MNYDFVDYRADIQFIIHCIGLQGKNIVGAEVGLFRAESFCTILQNCPNVSKLYGIDSWKPYTDYLGIGPMEVQEKDIDLVKFQAYHNFKWSGETDRGVILEQDSKDAVMTFDDNSLDFIFLDSYLAYEQALDDLNTWYNKVKPGGLFAGHDWNTMQVKEAVTTFRKDNNIEQNMSCYGDTWIWKKDE